LIINNLHLNIAESCNFICIVLHKPYIFALEIYKTKAQQVSSSIRSIECSMQKAKFIDIGKTQPLKKKLFRIIPDNGSITFKFNKMETMIKKAWKAKVRRTNPDVYFSDKAIEIPTISQLAVKAIGRVAMGLMKNCEIIYSDDKEFGAHYDKEENHIYIFQRGEQLQFSKPLK